MDPDVCGCCGIAMDPNRRQRNLKFGLPQAVVDLPERERTPGTWLSHDTANASIMMRVPNCGVFVRSQLPVQFAGGFTVSFGVWLMIYPDDLHPVMNTFLGPKDEYANLRITGLLANNVPPWDLFGSPVEAIVRDTTEIPVCAHSTEFELERLLYETWPHSILREHYSQFIQPLPPGSA